MDFREIACMKVGSELRGTPEAPSPLLCTALLQPAGVGSQAELIAFDISSQQVDVKPPAPSSGVAFTVQGLPEELRRAQRAGVWPGWEAACAPGARGWGPSRCLDLVARAAAGC